MNSIDQPTTPRPVPPKTPARQTRNMACIATIIGALVLGLLALAGPAAVAKPGPIILTPPPFVTQTYTWWQGQARIRMAPVSTHVCVLTRVGGDLEGAGEYVNIGQDSGGYWTLGGASLQSEVNGAARCFRRSQFTSPYGTANWLSNPVVNYTFGTDAFCGAASSNAWWGDAATYLASVGGDMEGQGESATVRQSTSGWTSSQVAGHTCATGWLTDAAYSFFVGRPSSGIPATFLSRYDTHGTAGTIAETTSAAADGSDTQLMARTDLAMCYLTEVKGKFRGGAERVEIIPLFTGGLWRWALRTNSGQDDGVSAKARCYARHQ